MNEDELYFDLEVIDRQQLASLIGQIQATEVTRLVVETHERLWPGLEALLMECPSITTLHLVHTDHPGGLGGLRLPRPVDLVVQGPADFLQDFLGRACLAQVQGLTLRGHDDELRWVCPDAPQLQRLTLQGLRLAPSSWTQAWASLSSMTEVGLMHVGPEGFYLQAPESPPGLTSLVLRGSPITEAALQHLEARGWMRPLRHLSLAYTKLSRSPGDKLPPSLEHLDLSGLPGPCAALTERQGLRHLGLAGCSLTHEAWSALTSGPLASSLVSVDLSGNPELNLQPDEAAWGRAMPALRDLNLESTGVDGAALAALGQGRAPGLRRLNLNLCQLGHLRPQAPLRFPQLESLQLDHAGLRVEPPGALWSVDVLPALRHLSAESHHFYASDAETWRAFARRSSLESLHLTHGDPVAASVWVSASHETLRAFSLGGWEGTQEAVLRHLSQQRYPWVHTIDMSELSFSAQQLDTLLEPGRFPRLRHLHLGLGSLEALDALLSSPALPNLWTLTLHEGGDDEELQAFARQMIMEDARHRAWLNVSVW